MQQMPVIQMLPTLNPIQEVVKWELQLYDHSQKIEE